jgi:hypothetical protein
MKNIEAINTLIASGIGGIKTDDISDGYHTFGELYEHRFRLFIELCRFNEDRTWYSLVNSDGSSYDGWFLLGMFKEEGKQITYHLPLRLLKEISEFAEEMETPPEFDGHTSEDVLKRLAKI